MLRAMTAGERRSARLLFGEELALGAVSEAELDRDEVVAAVREMARPSGIARRLQVRALDRGDLTYTDSVAPAMLAARRAVLGDRAPGAPRVLLRVDAFPAPGVPAEALAAVAQALAADAVPWLLTIDPAALPLEDRYVLRGLADAGVAFGLRARLDDGDAAATLDAATAALRDAAMRADVLAPTPGTLRAADYAAAAQRFDVIAGGPEDVRHMGFHGTPLWRGDAVWLPAHPPLAGRPSGVAAAVTDLAEEQAALWMPAVVELAALATDPAATARLAAALAGNARPWDEFLAAVRASRDAA